MSEKIRVRFAPSPTGYLHVGGARTALYNWLYARKMKGTFVLRIEDTDQARSTEEALQMQMGDLKWLGLNWDEGPGVGGAYGPYKQSERLHIYAEHADRLFAAKKAYYCFCTDEMQEEKKALALKRGLPPHYDGTCRSIPLEDAKKRRAAGEKAAVRFHIGVQKDYTFKDLIRDEVKFPAGMVGDFVILRSDGMPVYNFCCVIDDAMMKITHVLRAEEHLSNTVRQLMLYEALNYPVPNFGHMSLILGTDRQKLSKRHGATSCNEYRMLGYMPEALKNFVALLGWSSPKAQEILSEAEMIEQFGLDRFTSSPAVFDEVKLKWMNATHLRALSNQELWARLKPVLKEAGLRTPEDTDWIDKSIAAFKSSIETFHEAIAYYQLVAEGSFQVHEEAKETLSWESSKKVVEGWKEKLSNLSENYLSEELFLKTQDAVKDATGAKGKTLFMPVRCAIIGKPHGTELKLIVPLIPRKELIRRAEVCLGAMG